MMINYSVDKNIFKFKYLPEFANFLLEKRLREFVTVGIRFCREADLPLLKPLSKYSEEELVELSMATNREILLALSKYKIAEHIEENIKKWIDNTIGIFESDSITAADLTLGFYLRRKIFSYFLDSYTKNVVEQKFIIGELDFYTTQEELITLNIFSQMQRQKLEKTNEELEIKSQLLIETQELAGMGSYLINFKDRSKSIYTSQYFKILEMEKRFTL